jgi:hypothetical protein
VPLLVGNLVHAGCCPKAVMYGEPRADITLILFFHPFFLFTFASNSAILRRLLRYIFVS